MRAERWIRWLSFVPLALVLVALAARYAESAPVVTPGRGGGTVPAPVLPADEDDALTVEAGALEWRKVRNDNVDAAAAIAGTKIAPAFGAQTVSATSADLTSDVTIGASPATIGALRIESEAEIVSRNAAGSGDVSLLWLDATDVVNLGTPVLIDGDLEVTGTLTATIPGSTRDAGMWTATANTNVFDSTAGADAFQVIVGSAFAEQNAAAGWALTASSCVLTYTGATRDVLVRAVVSAGPLNTEAYFAVAHNNDLVGASTTGAAQFAAGAVAEEKGTSLDDAAIPVERLLTVANGDTVRLVAGKNSAAADMPIYRMTLIVDPL